MPREPYLVVDPADVLRRLGVHEPTEDQVAAAIDAIVDAQDDVISEIGRELEPRTVVLSQQFPVYGAVDLDDWRSWAPGLNEDYAVLSHVGASDGSYVLTLAVGLDGRAERPIVRFVTAAATTNLRESPEQALGKRIVTSLSAEGQSISYAASPIGAAGSGAAGAPPALDSLRRYKRRAIYKPNATGYSPWPYGGLG